MLEFFIELMSQFSKRQQIQTLIEGKKHTPKEISQIVDVSLATVYNTRKNRLPHRRPKTIGELKKRLQKIWETIDTDFLRPYWESMQKRCNMVLTNNGFKIKYKPPCMYH